MTRPTAIRLVVAGLALAALVGIWATLAPKQLGGPATYAFVVGSSMEPKLHRGDLAIVRGDERAAPGDVVLYHDQVLGREILHRVVALDGGRIVTKGDNNDFRDAYRPAPADVHGELWLRVPALGSALQWLREPRHAALVVGLTVVLALAAGTSAGAGSRGRRRAPRPPITAPTWQPALAVALGALGFFFLLGLVAWTRPAERSVSEHVATQSGRFSYSADVARTAVYPDGRIETGEPVFLQLARRVDVRFGWTLEAVKAAEADGTARLDAVLSDGHGWQRTFEVVGNTPFTGANVDLAGIVDLAEIGRVTASVDRLTGAGVATWSLALRPSVHTEAVGRPLAFGPSLGFQLDPVRLQPDPGEGTLASTLEPRSEVRAERRESTVLPLGLPVGWARVLAIAGMLSAFARRSTRPLALGRS